MTHFKDKPKRKRKPSRRRVWLILLLCALVGSVVAIAVPTLIYIVGEAVFVKKCNIDMDKHYLHPENRNHYLAIGNLQSNIMQDIGFDISQAIWLADGKSFIYHTENPDTNLYITHQYILETGEIISFDELSKHITRTVQYPSPDGRFMLQTVPKYDKPNALVRIVDVEKGNIAFDNYATGRYGGWSPAGSYVRLRTTGYSSDYLIDIRNNQFIMLPFIHETSPFIGWVDDSHLIYRTEDGRLTTYNVITREFAFNIAGIYPNQIQFSPHIWRKKWAGMLDDKSHYWIIDLETQTRRLIDGIDFDRNPNIVLYSQSLNILYPDTLELDFVELNHGYRATTEYESPDFPSIADSGHYYIYFQSFGDTVRIYVQDFRTNERIFLDTIQDIKGIEWISIEEQDYVYFVRAKDNNPDSYLHYLYNAEIQQTCLVSQSQAYSLKWQP